MGKSTISMAISNSYVNLPEGSKRVTSRQLVKNNTRNPKYQLTNSIAHLSGAIWCHANVKLRVSWSSWWLRSLFPRSQFWSQGSGLDQTDRPKYVQRLIDFFWPNSLHRSSTGASGTQVFCISLNLWPMDFRQREPQIVRNGRPFLEPSLSVWPFKI